MTITDTLTKLGLEPREAKVYLAALELGSGTVLEIAKRAGVKRPTCYLILDDLAEKGFVAKTKKNNKPLFVAARPNAVMRSLRSKEELLGEIMPELRAIMATSRERPKVTIYEGKDEVRQIFDEIFLSKEILWFGSIRDVNRHFPESPKRMAQIARTRNPIVRDLLIDTPEDIAFARATVGGNYQVRIMPKGLEAFIDCAIHGNKISILAVKKDLFAVSIESKEVVDSFRSLHALAWAGATPIEKIP